MNSRLWLGIWVALIVVVAIPWGTLQPYAHWERVQWIPFVSPRIDFLDVIGNVLFYVPYGFLGALQAADTRRPTGLVMGSAAALSICSEFSQIFDTTRFPSMTDVTCNLAGAYIGLRWAVRQRTRERSPSGS